MNRDVLIYMNNPLRYRGETYYQAGFQKDDTASILQVVRNPSFVTPYIACIIVGCSVCSCSSVITWSDSPAAAAALA